MSKKGTDYQTFLGFIEKLDITLYDFKKHIKCTYSEEEFMGEGASMAVYRGTLEKKPGLNIPVAVKVPHFQMNMKTPDKKLFVILDNIRQELRIMKHLSENPYIINI